MSKEKKEVDILDEVRRLEKITKARLLKKAIQKIKSYAKEILELKEKTQIELELIGISDGDVKKIIDFVNSLPEVALSEEDKKDIREDLKTNLEKNREEAERKSDETNFSQFFTTDTNLYRSNTNTFTTGSDAYTMNLSSGSNTASIKL